jgi:hypothetical protein
MIYVQFLDGIKHISTNRPENFFQTIAHSLMHHTYILISTL